MALDYTKETALYQPDAIGNGILDARGKAERYITSVTDSGIFVHTEESPRPTVPETTGNNGVHISNDVDIIANGVNVASYGADARIGVQTSDHVTIDSEGLTVYQGANEVCSLKKYTSINGNIEMCCLELEDDGREVRGYTVGSKKYLGVSCYGTSISLDSEGDIDLNGAVNINGHSIGSISADSRTTDDLTGAGIQYYVNGAAVSLTAGTYVITAQATFPKRYKAIGDPTEPDYTNLEIQIYNLTSSTVLGRQRIVVYKNAVTVLQAHCIISIASPANVNVRVSAGYCCDGCDTSINTVCIA